MNSQLAAGQMLIVRLSHYFWFGFTRKKLRGYFEWLGWVLVYGLRAFLKVEARVVWGRLAKSGRLILAYLATIGSLYGAFAFRNWEPRLAVLFNIGFLREFCFD